MIKKRLHSLIEKAGITINGSNPWDPQVYDDALYMRIAKEGGIGLGESFMDKQWDVEQLDEFYTRVQKIGDDWHWVKKGGDFLLSLKSKLFNMQKGARAYEVGQEHYDLGNDLYQAMLDKRMVYTAGYWKEAQNLDEAQEAKLDLICRKLNLKPGDRVLDIGCGWGSFMKFAAEKYGAVCTGLTVSVEQTKLGEELCEGLPVEFVVMDYQKYEPEEQFDHIVSVEMFEAVGEKNFRTYMECVERWLKDGGRFVLQTIGAPAERSAVDWWIDKYIFPNGVLPTAKQIKIASEGLLVSHDWHDIGKDYDPTLMAWWEQFDAAYPTLDQQKYDERFYRMWKYYLQMCAAGFRTGYLYDWQIVFTKPGVSIPDVEIR